MYENDYHLIIKALFCHNEDLNRHRYYWAGPQALTLVTHLLHWLGPKYLKEFYGKTDQRSFSEDRRLPFSEGVIFDWYQRFQLLQTARNGGSMTPSVMTKLPWYRRDREIKWTRFHLTNCLRISVFLNLIKITIPHHKIIDASL